MYPENSLKYGEVVSMAIEQMIEEGYDLNELILNKVSIPEYIRNLESNSVSNNLSLNKTQTTDTTLTEAVTEPEIQSLYNFIETIDNLRLSFQPQRLDVAYFDNHYECLVNSVSLLKTNTDPDLIEFLRKEVRNEAIRTMLSLMLKHVPRFYRDIKTAEVLIDSNSSTWSPDYYRMDEAEVEKVLSRYLMGKSILDPFGGSGAMTSVITAHGLPQSVIYSDLSYAGGIGIKDQPYNYDPILNISMLEQLFRDLPSGYRPELNRIKGFVTANSTNLPFADNTFDLIFGDPPYGRTLKNGGVPFFMTFINELLRVSKEGGIFMVPLDWIEELNKTGIKYEKLTGDPSFGGSGYPICYIYVPKNT